MEMNTTNALQIFEAQSSLNNASMSMKSRKAYLKRLAQVLREQEVAIKQALFQDLRKHPTEAFITEIYPVLSEIKLFLSHLSSWAKPQKVANNLVFTGSKASVVAEPKGRCLLITPWNYPFQLPLLHLVACIAAGNTAIIKPSEFTPHVSALLKDIVGAVFPTNCVAVLEGNLELSSYLLSLPFDHIHFTGSPKVGKIVMNAAAENLSSCTLELGGKSPFIIDDSIDMTFAAQKLITGKFINLGQTCIAPDYVLLPKSRKEAFVKTMEQLLVKAFGTNMEDCNDLSRIINIDNYNRLQALMKDAKQKGATIAFGGVSSADTLFVPPTLITDIAPDATILMEEIFGPLLPIVTYETQEEAVAFIKLRPKPLALYLFSKQKSTVRYFQSHTSSGSFVVNDVMIHMLHPNLPFGGVNQSGIGQSTGYYGFKDFSHEKPVLKTNTYLSPTRLLTFPYRKYIEKLLKKLV